VRGLKGLLWKEWRQYYGSFLLAFIVISVEPVLIPVSYWIYRVGDRADAWSDSINIILAPGSSTMETTAMIVAVLLAALMLAGERGGSLNYLVSTPVSRREIIKAKFITGSLALIVIMSLISLFLLVSMQVLPAQYSARQVIQWAGLTTAALICLFSLALMVASFSGGILSSALFTAIITGLPWMLVSVTTQVLHKFYQIPTMFELKVNYIVTYLCIPDYITRDGRYIWSSDSNLVIDRVIPDYPLEITVLLLAALLFLWLAIKIFEKNPLERQGELLLFGNFKQIGLIFLSFLSALGWAGDTATSLTLFLIYFPLMWLGLYLALAALAWVITWLTWQAWGRG
jgi:ABC-type transport system involved in multi-copper enzyme maturation permease subunit